MVKVFEVSFELDAQTGTAGRFSVPKAVTDILDINHSNPLLVEVVSRKGALAKVAHLKSGREIYGDFDGHIEPGEHIAVRVTRLS